MSNPHFSTYVSPNIVIVPTVSFCGPPPKKQKPSDELQPVEKAIPPIVPVKTKPCATVYPRMNTFDVTVNDKGNVTENMPILQNSTSSAEDTRRNSLEDCELRVKKTLSWASNYLQSIGLTQTKVTKLTQLAHQKLFPKVDESRNQNMSLTLWKPILNNVNAQSHSNIIQHISSEGDGKNITPTSTNSVTNFNSSNDKKYPIKINLLSYKGNTDLHSVREHAQNANISNTLKYEHLNMAETPNSTNLCSKSDKLNKIDCKIFVKNKTHDNFREKTDRIKTQSREQTHESYSFVKNTSTKDRNKLSTEKKPVTKHTDFNKSSYKSESKNNLHDRIDRSSDRIQNHSQKLINHRPKNELEAWASYRIKKNPEKDRHFHSNKSQSKNRNTREEKKDKNIVKDKESQSRKGKNIDDHKSKSKLQTKCNDDYKNESNSSKKSSDTRIRKSSEIPHSTPIKSVVQVKNKNDLDCSLNTSEYDHRVKDLRTKLNLTENCHVEDLRTKLKRKHQNSQSKPVERDNLIISVQNNNNENEEISKPTTEEKPKSEKKAKKYKKIKLVINVICENSSESSESDSDDKNIENNEEVPLANEDLSFLDDFNVDDIVESLKDQDDKENNNKSPSERNQSKSTEKLVDEHTMKTEDSKNTKHTTVKDRLDTEPSQLIIKGLNEHARVNNILKDGDDASIPFSNIEAIPDLQIVKNISKTIIQSQDVITVTQLGENSSTIVADNSKESNIGETSDGKESNIIILDNKSININDNCLSQLNVASNDDKALNSQNQSINIKSVTNTPSQKVNVNVSKVNNNSKTEEQAEDLNIIDLTQIEVNMPDESEKASLHKDLTNAKSIQAEPNQCKPNDKSVPAVNDLIDLTLLPDIITELTKDAAGTKQTNAPSSGKASKIVNKTMNYKTTSSRLLPSANKKLLMIITQIDLTKSPDEPTCYNESLITTSEIPEKRAAKECIQNVNDLTEITLGTTNAFVAPNPCNDDLTSDGQKKIESEISPIIEKYDINKTSIGTSAIKDPSETAIILEKDNEPSSLILTTTLQDNMHNALKIQAEKDTGAMKIENDTIHSQLTQILEKTEMNDIEQVSADDIEISKTQDTNIVIDKLIDNQSTGTAQGQRLEENEIHKEIVTKTILLQTENNLKETVYPQASDSDLQETVKPVKEDFDDVLSITIDKNLTSNISMAIGSNKTSINSSTCSKNVFINDKKEEVATEIKQFEGKPIDTSKEDKSRDVDSSTGQTELTPNYKSNSIKTQEVLRLENRMNQYLHSNYSIESFMKHGKFSKIYRCKDENGRNYALKVLHDGKRMSGRRIEDMMKKVQKDIPRSNYHCVFLVDGFGMMDHWCFLMDYYPKNLQQALKENGKCFHIDVVQILARQLISAVLILRNNNIMHLDIKPTHVLMNTSNDRLKLAGFDESQYLEGLSVLPCVGTVNYRPPEVIIGYPYFEKIDVWSTALVIYEMCTRRQLFPGIYNNDILYKHMCTFGNLPYEMIVQSVFTNYHYRGPHFARKMGPNGKQCALVYNFKKSRRLEDTIFGSYYNDWGMERTKRQKDDDSAKLCALRDLLGEMLILNPTRRMPIEFVYANSFIYETFDSCI